MAKGGFAAGPSTKKQLLNARPGGIVTVMEEVIREMLI